MYPGKCRMAVAAYHAFCLRNLAERLPRGGVPTGGGLVIVVLTPMRRAPEHADEPTAVEQWTYTRRQCKQQDVVESNCRAIVTFVYWESHKPVSVGACTLDLVEGDTIRQLKGKLLRHSGIRQPMTEPRTCIRRLTMSSG